MLITHFLIALYSLKYLPTVRFFTWQAYVRHIKCLMQLFFYKVQNILAGVTCTLLQE